MATLLYNPDRKNKQEFIAEFVVRTRIFEEIFSDIQSSTMKYPEQSYLLIGQRGLGKTTLLTRLRYAIEDDSNISKFVIPVAFSEEQYGISELVNLWEEIAIYLEDHHGYGGLLAQIQRHAHEQYYEETAFGILKEWLDRDNKKLILLIDNIGVLLGKFDINEVRRLREILQTTPHLRIIGGSTTVLESVTDYLQPLYEFFKVYQLKGLTHDECITLLNKLAEIHGAKEVTDRIIAAHPERIETIRTLSGGVPRTMAMLFQVFVDNEHGSALSDLERILDLVTPLYKHRMDDLPPQQQKIVDAVARHWDAVSVKQLTDQLRMDSKLVSAQLRQLEKNQVIEKRLTGKKNHLYLLSERFFNIWYLMRYGRKEGRQRVIWLVKFMEVWCDRKDIEGRIMNYVEKSKTGVLDENTLKTYGELYSHFKEISPDIKLSLKQATPEYISNDISMSESELSDLINEAISKKDWEKLVTVCSFNDLTSSQIHQISFQIELSLYISMQVSQKKLKLNQRLYNVHKSLAIIVLCAYFEYAMSKKKHEMLIQANKMFSDIYKIAFVDFSDYDLKNIDYYFISAMTARLYETVSKLFAELYQIDSNIIHKHKIAYYALQKLMGHDISVLDDAQTEQVNNMIGTIEDNQKRLGL